MAVTLPLLVLFVLFSNANAACNKSFTLSSDTFATENFPNRNFTGYCHYQIKLPFRRAIDLQWLAFDVGSPKVNSKCPDNYVTVSDGAFPQIQHTYTFCGKQPQNITSKTNILSIILYVNSNCSHQGFRVKYTSRIELSTFTPNVKVA
ncbi:expressed hypothetical protein [Trichoplax adhaerens]|uniref:CUB domain-containing protein n=1 Tax=Trichoplax adhaerens TaxID=10228 RepID=B3RMS1_TRIAD|nr:expressed hypothetical protein [Trichoplax adhaerens]EDV27325.1 expressed hypothetical protein [Trichoplax adhaerens]|eukprot:XP_002109159.1 expressed hypothetical protein [Trichoplax adhaerens]